MNLEAFLSRLDEARIVAAIRDAESRTTGEIRVFVTHRAAPDPIARATRRFEKLGMTETWERNAVLLYFAPANRKFAVIGDRGIHEKCGASFWEETVAQIGAQLRTEHFTDAIVLGVRQVGDLLARHFPGPGGSNELPDEVQRD
jgi:uncharacterized membrane protein